MKQVVNVLSHAWRLAEPWSLVTLSALAATCVVAGVFEPANAGWVAAIIGGLVSGSALFDGQQRLKDEPRTGPLVAYEGPLLWVTLTWLFMRWSGSFSGEMLVVSAALLAWVYVALPKQVSRACFGYSAVLEVGLVIFGHQSVLACLIHGIVIGAVVQGLSRFAASEAFRTRLDEARERHEKEADDRERARGFGLLTAQAPMLGGLPDLRESRPTVGRVTLDFLDQSFAIQMEVLRDALGLNTAAVLWLSDNGLYLRGVSSHRTDILPGPFPSGLGIPGSVLQSGDQVSLSQVHKEFGGIPYYERAGGVGSVLALAITKPIDQTPMGVLVVDR
ncbi:MAG: GAF domain-containing protein, partial [Myxococcota bacterium]|nr:GAF domain-containing protein [Myxococcota bacterium]